LLACPAVGAANESAPDKPVAATTSNKKKIKERKFCFLILIIEVSLLEYALKCRTHLVHPVVIQVDVVCRVVSVVDSKTH
jgi:hypothetical protein